MEQYKKFSKIYDRLMYDCDYQKWSQYLLSEIISAKGKNAKGADLASGSGTMTILLKQGGLDVFGVDISSAMVFEAQKKAREKALKIQFILSDAVEFETHKPLDFVTMCLDGVNYIDRERIDALFQRVYNNLNKGGLFLFDVSTEYKLYDYIGENIFFDDGEDVTYLWANEKREDGVTYDLSFFVLNEEGLYERFDERHELFGYGSEFLEERLLAAGFSSVLFRSEDFSNELKEKDMRMHIVAKKD